MFRWTPEGLRLRNVATGEEVPGEGLVEILELFGDPLVPADAVRRLSGHDSVKVRAQIRALRRLGFLLTERESKRARSRLSGWRGNIASAQYHAVCRDLQYLSEPGEMVSHVRAVILPDPRPAAFKRYARGRRRALPGPKPAGDAEALERVLKARETVREFRSSAVPLDDFSHLFRTTFGITGMLVTDLFGGLATRTSPSAGALHPIEAYAIVWNVDSLVSGVYHFDMLGNYLTLLRGGDFRAKAVEAASGQKWVSRAAFLCILTAAFPRVLWKYRTEDSYRTLFLDAGHLAQTFCLVATSLGLGPFTTAAIQDTKIEKLLRIDGIEEFPVYLCGAGVPETDGRRGGKSRDTAPPATSRKQPGATPSRPRERRSRRTPR